MIGEMTIGILGTIHGAMAMARSFVGPAVSALEAIGRLQIGGLSDTAVTRFTQWELDRAVVNRTDEPNYSPLLLDPGQVIHLIHQSPPQDAMATWRWGKSVLSNFGIDVAMPGEANAPAVAQDWRDYIRMQAASAPLHQFVAQYWRTAGVGGEAQANAEADLSYALRRHSFSRQPDRDLVIAPWREWGASEAARLYWHGMIDGERLNAILGAAGYGREEDLRYVRALMRVMPPPGQLMQWDARHLWDNDLADTYGLDRGTDGTPVADFWSKAQGLGARAPDLPGQPAEGNDWLRMEHRASHPLPGFGECLEMQWRFRPSPDDPTQSVVPGTPPWTMQNTREVLQLHGYTEPVIEWMLGLAVAPLSFRIANHILIPSMRNDEIRMEMQRQLGPAQDWLTRMFRDHGQPSERARLLAQGMIEQADRSANSERWEAIKAQRKQWRDTYLSAYELGTVSYADAHQQIQDDWFGDQQATRALAIVDQERSMGVVKRQLSALRSTWMRGAISSEQATTAMQALGIVGPRQEQYGLEWRWERTEAVRILNTGETLTALRNGLLTPQTAIARLLAMGWSQPDALVEVAQAEQAVAAARQKVAMATQRAAVSAREKQQRAAAKEAAAAAKEVAHAAKMGDRQQLAEVLAPHRLLMAQSKYYAAVHQGNAEYAAAEKKHDEERMAAILQRQMAEYHGWLLSQLKTVASVNDGTASEDSIDTAPAAGAGEGS